MVNWRGVLHTSGRILGAILNSTNHDRDIEVNSKRIEYRDTMIRLRKLRSRRASTSDKHKKYKINWEIHECLHRLGELKDEYYAKNRDF